MSAAVLHAPGPPEALRIEASPVPATGQVLVTGVIGGMGLPALRISRHASARVTAVIRSEARRDTLLDAGLDAGAHAMAVATAGVVRPTSPR